MARSKAEYPNEPVAGEWWLPGNRAGARAGALVYAPKEKPSLQLMSGWPAEDEVWGESIERDVVHGQSTDLDAMTLLDSRDYARDTHSGGDSSGHNREIEGTLLVFGAHTPALADLNIGQLTLQHTCGPVAVHKHGIGWKHRFDNHPDGGGLDASFDEVDARSIVVGGIEVQLAVNATIDMAETTSRGVEIDLRATPTFNIRSSDAATSSFPKLWTNFALPLGALLRFAADLDGGWHHVAFRNSDASEHSRLLRLHHNKVVDANNYEIPYRHEHGFHIDCVGYAELIPSWLELHDKFGESIGAGLEGCFASWGSEQIRLLALGLEGLSDIAQEHERRFDDKQREIVKRALAECEGLHPDAKGAALGELSRVTLNSRLESIAKEIEAIGASVPTEILDHLPAIKAFRNQFSHPDPGRDIDGARLTRAIAAAKGLFRAGVISQLGLTQERREHLASQALERAARDINLFTD